MNNLKLWAQTEFWFDESYETAFAIEKPYNKYSFLPVGIHLTLFDLVLVIS